MPITIAPLPLTDAKTAKLAEINAAYAEALAAVKAGYPPDEILSWDKQEREARAYQADSTAATPFLDALSAARGVDKPTLADRIMAKVAAADDAVGTATGRRQAREDTIQALIDRTTLPTTDPDYLTEDQARTEIEAVVW
jgi:hypothetical protein